MHQETASCLPEASVLFYDKGSDPVIDILGGKWCATIRPAFFLLSLPDGLGCHGLWWGSHKFSHPPKYFPLLDAKYVDLLYVIVSDLD